MAKQQRIYRGSPGSERTSVRRAQLVAAGRKLFGRAGYSAVSVRGVCVEAGLTERYFYESFANREQLLGEVYLDCVAGLSLRVNTAIEDTARLEERIRTGLGAYFTFMKKDPLAARVVLFEVLGVSERIDLMYQTVMAQFAALLRERLGLKNKELVASGLVGAAVHIAMQWVLSGYRQSHKAVVDSCVRIFLAVAEDK